jgi:hypothetical protein
MRRLQYLLSWFLVCVATPAFAASGRYAIGVDRIAAAMADMGMQVSPGQLTMMTTPVASTAEPQLRVQSMQRWPGDRVVVRMECESQQQCLPFFVSVRLRAESASMAPAAALAPAPMAPQKVQTSQDAVVRAGSPATLFLDGNRIHIRVAVTCMQAGKIGETIRAQGPDHQQTYIAQVTGAGMLKGRL